MAITIDGTNGITLPSGSAAVGTSDTQTLTNKTVGSGYGGSTIVAATAQNSTSGTFIDFTSIPSWVKRITVMFNGVSTNGTSDVQIQLGTSSGITTSGYLGDGSNLSGGVGTLAYTAGFGINAGGATVLRHGSFVISSVGSNIWVASGNIGISGLGNYMAVSAGSVTLSGALDRVRITTVNGTDTFDAGSINILYE